MSLRSTRIVSACLFAAALSLFGTRAAQARETAANDCLVGVQDADSQTIATEQNCTDGAACDADGATNGTCAFHVRGCVNLPVSGCTPRPIKKVRFVTPHSNDEFVVTPVSGQASSVCGSFIDFHVPLKKKGKKPGKRKINATAIADVKPFGKNKDSDKLKFTCTPCPTESCVPPTTTSTTTTTSAPTTTTSVALPACGDGTVNGSEACDPAAATTGCGAGQTCMPAGAITECTCKTCAAINPVQTMRFTTSAATTDFCGDAGLVSNPNNPTTGLVTTDTNATIPLGAGCLYIGGGGAGVPGGIIPDGSQSNFNLTQDCGGEQILEPQNPGSTTTCTQAAGPGKACINDLTLWPNLTTCTTDNDCPMTGPGNTVAAGSCVDKPNCLFGPPLPIENGPVSTCVVNTIGDTPGGSLNKTSGTAQVTLPLRSHTFIRPPNDVFPCPQCKKTCAGGGNDGNNCDTDNDCPSGTCTGANECTAGPRAGMACATTSVAATGLTTIDCPPSAAGGAYLPEFSVNLVKLTTGTSSKSNADGLFCPNQRTFSAFGGQNRNVRPDGDPNTPPIKIVEISESGSPAGDLSDNLAHTATLAAVFCIPETGNGLIDGAADLAGPGAVSLPGSVQILP
jgi:hypothetical protein